MEPVREVAKAIRPYLPELLGEEAVRIDRLLSDLLTEDDPSAEGRIAAVLTSSPELHSWVAGMLADPELLPPPLRVPGDRGFDPLPGASEPVAATRYACPIDGNYVWYRPSMATAVVHCPDHDVLLVRDQVRP